MVSKSPQTELERVEVVGLDMSTSFYASVKSIFGDQVQVIDRFHVVQQAVNALAEVLRAVQKKSFQRRGERDQEAA